MELNVDFSRRAAVHASQVPWTPSPVGGVMRRMLDRIGAEVARATSIVRYTFQSRFSTHTHGGGEELLVLDGMFSDEHGDFPSGFYIRNPPTSSHTPESGPGCTIFVKLWQFDPEDRTYVRIDTNQMQSLSMPDRPGIAVMPLFRNTVEDVRLERWPPGDRINLAVPAGIEILVLEGTFEEGGEIFESQSWLRLPAGATLNAKAGPGGCKIWVKTGHLAHAQVAPVETGATHEAIKILS